MNQDLKTNIARLPKNFSTYVVAIVTGGAYYWLQMSPAEQQAMITAYPWLKHVAPLSAFVAFLAARVWPQNGAPSPAPDTEPQA
jgi:hypothetical protein